MIRQPFDHMAASRLLYWLWRSVRQRAAALRTPKDGAAAPGGRRRMMFAWAGIILGLVVQMVLLWLLGQLVDLCISLMELWAEMAAKHLEITLDTTP